MAMRNRLRRNIDQRTELLAGVSHDLRTPLTRMKLELAILDKEIDVANLKSDVQDMVNMIDGYLAFARNQDTEQATETQLNAILDDVVQNVRRQGYNIELDIADLDPLPLRRNSFKRCITNLVDNAIRYTANEKNNDSPRISISACQKAGLIEIAVDDNGPGIPPNQRENAFRPFHRLESARSHSNAGVGLGLTIARDIVRSHGGDVKLLDSPKGGLRAIIELPT